MKKYITVAGRFHYHNYVDKILLNEGYEFIYSHKLNSNDSGNKRNLPLKEYLVRGHLKLFGDKFREHLFPLYHKLWELQLSSAIENPLLWHFMLHGNNPSLVERYKDGGNTILIGEAVNTHPAHYIRVINKERIFRGLEPMGLSLQDKKIIKEASASTALLCPSSYVKKTFDSEMGEEKEKYIINFSANVNRFYEVADKRRQGKIKIGYVGQLILRKGILYLLEAISKIGSKNIELHVVGYMAKEMMVFISPYLGSIFYYESIKNEKINEFYNSIDLFVLPTLEEGLALVLCEAMAAGVPIITTEESGVLDICVDKESVHIVKSSSAQALAEAISYCIDNSEYCDYLKENAGVIIRNKSGWDEYAKEIMSMHNGLIRDAMK